MDLALQSQKILAGLTATSKAPKQYQSRALPKVRFSSITGRGATPHIPKLTDVATTRAEAHVPKTRAALNPLSS
jgi:hypothetical protein